MSFKQFLFEYSSTDLYDLEDEIKEKYHLSKFSLVQKPGSKTIILKLIVVDKDKRSQGAGSKAIQDLCTYADKNKLAIALEPMDSNPSTGTISKEKLISFYKRFGFVSVSKSEMRRAPG